MFILVYCIPRESENFPKNENFWNSGKHWLSFFFRSSVFLLVCQFLQPNGRIIWVADSSVHVADCGSATGFLKACDAWEGVRERNTSYNEPILIVTESLSWQKQGWCENCKSMEQIVGGGFIAWTFRCQHWKHLYLNYYIDFPCSQQKQLSTSRP